MDPKFVIERWNELRERLDAVPLGDLCDRMLLDRRLRAGHVVPAACPRQECRHTELGALNDGWNCWQCGADGKGAALVAAYVVGWRDETGPDDARAPTEMLRIMQEVVFGNLLALQGDAFSAWCDTIPGIDQMDIRQRGMFYGDDRRARARELGLKLGIARFGADEIARLSWAWNLTYCRPPLKRDDLAKVLMEVAASASMQAGRA